jgi:prophage tail gpP-like protein
MSGPQSDLVTAAVTIGAEATLSINGHTQGDGYIDEIEQTDDREGGTQITISGRDRLAPMVDASADPMVRFGLNATLVDFIVGVAGPFGWGINDLIIYNDDNRAVMQGGVNGTKTTKKGKPLKSFVAHLEKPYPGEGAFAFLSRVTQRFGLWVGLSAEGNQLIVSKPNFDQAPSYQLRRLSGSAGVNNNVLSGRTKRSTVEQPSIVIAEGFSGGGEFGKSRIKSIVINPAVSGFVGDIVAKYPEAVQTDLGVTLSETYFSQPVKPLYLRDEDAKTQEQLDNFVKRALALRMRKSFEYHCTVEGHSNSGLPWCLDAVVDVQDELANVSEPLYILDRTFEKSRNGGTLTHLTMVRLGSISF